MLALAKPEGRTAPSKNTENSKLGLASNAAKSAVVNAWFTLIVIWWSAVTVTDILSPFRVTDGSHKAPQHFSERLPHH